MCAIVLVLFEDKSTAVPIVVSHSPERRHALDTLTARTAVLSP